MKKKLDKVTRAMVRRAVLYLLDKYNIPYEVPVTAQNAVQIASQLYAEGILTAEMLVEINLSSEMLSELTLESTVGTEANLILNQVTGATAAYSLRQINASYTGPLIRVRRSDNQELDITGSPLGLNETQLLNFVGSGNGFVTTIYDQAGQARHLTQSVAANQPRIVSNGIINRVNNKPAILFDGINDWFRRTYAIGTIQTRFAVLSNEGNETDATIMLDDGANPDRAYLVVSSPGTLRLYAGTNFYYPGTAKSIQFSTYNLFNSNNSQATVNNQPITTGSVSSGTTAYSGISLGTRGGPNPGYYSNFNFQEVILYSGDRSANRAQVMNDFNRHYQIYWDGNQQRLLDQYPNAAAAYSLRNLRSTYTGPLLRVRRSSDNLELNIYGKYDGFVDTQSLMSFCAGTNGFVTTWYDQSSGNWNAIQTVATNQPQIVMGGAVNQQNGKPAIRFYDTGTQLQSATLGNFTDIMTTFSVHTFFNRNAQTSPNVYDQGVAAYRYRLASNVIQAGGNTFINGGNYVIGATYLTYIYFNIVAPILTVNNSVFTGTMGTTIGTATAITLGSNGVFGVNTYFNGNFQEFVTYRSDQSANQADIRTNINSFYNIY